MIKKHNGFALVETLIVSTVVATILIYIFIQFNNLTTKYENSFKYNDVDDLYRLDNIATFINSMPLDSKNLIANEINNNSKVLISLKDGAYKNINYFDNHTSFLEDLNIKNLVITKADIDSLDTSFLSQNMKNMIKKINTNDTNYRLLVEFNNDSLATIKFDMEGV